MERLPNEIQLEIFSKLPTEDRLTCLFVSKAWNKAAKTCVFNNVTISDERKLTIAMIYFTKNGDLANQVTNLEINCENIYHYLSQFQQLFVNVSSFKVGIWSEASKFHPKMTPTLGWKKLEYIETRESYYEKTPPILQLILSGHCPNLTKVCTERTYSFTTSDYTIMKYCAQIITLLKNAPQLTTLDFGHLQCTVNDLERLHQNTPNLRKLILSKNTEILKTNKPIKAPNLDTLIAKFEANTLTHVDVRKVFTFLEHLEIWFFPSIVADDYAPHIYALFDFIGKKYWGLQFFSMTGYTENGGEEYLKYIYETFDREIIEERLLPLFARCPGLTHYDQFFSPLSSAITHEMDESSIQLKKLALYLDEMTMDAQLDALFGSQQPRYIEDLSVYQIGGRDDIEDIYEWPTPRFASMINLKKMYLEGRMGRICLSELANFLKHCPQVEEFEFKQTAFYLTQVDMDLPVLALRSLKIDEFYIDSNVQSKKAEKCLNNVLSHSPKLEKVDLVLQMLQPKDNTKPFTFTFDFRKNTKLKKIDIGREEYMYKNRYYIKSPMMTGYYYISYVNCKSKLNKTTPFPAGEFYATILLPDSVDVNKITIE